MEDNDELLTKNLGFLKKKNIIEDKVRIRKGDLFVIFQRLEQENEKEDGKIRLSARDKNYILTKDYFSGIFSNINPKNTIFKLAISKEEFLCDNAGNIRVFPIAYLFNLLGEYYISKQSKILFFINKRY